jgi:hypothetical protein
MPSRAALTKPGSGPSKKLLAISTYSSMTISTGTSVWVSS